MTAYYRRFILISLVLALLTAGLAIWQPGARASVASTAPQGDAVPVTASIRVTFDDQVDRALTGQSLRIVPAVPGEISWQQDALVFTPSRPLTPTVDYRVTVAPASSRSVGAAAVSWNFRTRARRLFYLHASGLWLADEKPARQVISESGITSFTLSPDGERVAYSTQRDDGSEALRIFSLNDGTTKTISDAPDERASQPNWSPANDFIAYTHSVRSAEGWQPGTIWLAQIDGTPLGPLALGLNGESPQFASGAQRLAFRNGTTLTVVSLGGAGGAVANDVGGPFAWSPDGSKLGYIDTQSQLRIADVATRSVQPATGTKATALAWLPNGTLAVARAGSFVITGADATNAPVTLCASEIAALAIAADGATLAATCAADEQPSQVVTASLDSFTLVVVGIGEQAQWGP